MKNLAIVFLLGILFGAALHAQSSSYVLVESAATVAGCAPSTGTPQPIVLCVTADSHIAVAGNGTTFTTVGASPVAVVQKVNGIAPDATGNVTVPLPTSATGTISLAVK